MSQKNLSRRDFLRLGALSTAGAALAACAPATPQTVEVTSEVPVEQTVEVPATVVVTVAPPPGQKTIRAWLGPFHPTQWTTRSAEHPVASTATRVLAEQFMSENPDVRIEWIDATGYTDSTTDHAAWLTARIAGGDAPDIIWCLHWVPVQNGWAMPIEEYLDQPNPFAPQYARWRDIFWPRLMQSLVQADGHEYVAPIDTEWPNLKYWLVYDVDYFNQQGLQPCKTWTEFKELSAALKALGSGLSPWPNEAASGNMWPLALQILPPMMQEVCVQMDTDGDFFVGTPEGLEAWKKGLIRNTTPLYRRAWREMYELASSWVDGFATADLELMWREARVHLRCEAQSTFTALYFDPTVPFEMSVIVPPLPTSQDVPPTADMPGASDPYLLTAGDGSVPGDYITALQSTGYVLLDEMVRTHDNADETMAWLQFMTTPENDGYVVNENQQWIPSAKDAPLGPLYGEVSKVQLPMYEYQIEWWGMGLFWDAAHFTNWRRIFVEWITGQIDEETFLAREDEEGDAGAARYEATLGT
jgi:ABC-type glycerol-3-phosphate transport system substrate-binding protein